MYRPMRPTVPLKRCIFLKRCFFFCELYRAYFVYVAANLSLVTTRRIFMGNEINVLHDTNKFESTSFGVNRPFLIIVIIDDFSSLPLSPFHDISLSLVRTFTARKTSYKLYDKYHETTCAQKPIFILRWTTRETWEGMGAQYTGLHSWIRHGYIYIKVGKLRARAWWRRIFILRWTTRETWEGMGAQYRAAFMDTTWLYIHKSWEIARARMMKKQTTFFSCTIILYP